MRGLEMPAILRATNLNQALGGAADGANVVTKGGAGAFRGSLLTQRADLHKQTVSGSSSAQFPWVLRCAKVPRPGSGVRIATPLAPVIPFAGLELSPGSDRVSKNPNRLSGV